MAKKTRKGYLSHFPEHWKVYRMDEILDRLKNKVEVKNEESYKQIGIRSHGKGIFYKEAVTGEELGDKSVFWIEPDCFIVNIVFAWEMAVAKTTTADAGLIASHRFPMYKPKPDLLDLDFLLYYFKMPLGKHLLGLASPGGAGRNKTLGQKEFAELEICIPSVNEQKRIAEILKPWDKAIKKNQNLIEQLELRKKGLIQQLLTGKKRLKGFNGKWNISMVGDYLIKHNEVTNSNNQYPVLTSSRKGLFFQKDYYNKVIASEDNTGYNVVPKGFFTYRHMSDDLIFKFNINTICEKGIVSTLYPVFTTKSTINKIFLKFALNEGVDFKRYALMQKQGGSRTYMYYGKLTELRLKLPPLEEQSSIVKVLTIADNEIKAQADYLTNLQAQKKGLLQHLLTGKIGLTN